MSLILAVICHKIDKIPVCHKCRTASTTVVGLGSDGTIVTRTLSMGRLKRRKYLLVLVFLVAVFATAFLICNILEGEGGSVSSTGSDLEILPDLSALSEEFDGFISGQVDWDEHPSDLFFKNEVDDKIGVFRELPDTRNEVCKKRVYKNPKKSKVSVIIAYKDEPRAILLRTIVSVIQRTPRRFLNELIVIDDFSDDDSSFNDLGRLPLGAFMKLHRNRRHYGLIESRNLGANISTGDYIVFLDSHCEVNIGWMEPLLDRLATYHGLAVSPILDSIDATTFQYQPSSENLKGGFDWNLHFQWIPMGEEERQAKEDIAVPFMSPTFAGGVFMISRNWFFKLNGFNPLLEAQDNESIEMSIKLWLCGGQIEIVPCSRVGHVVEKANHSLDQSNGQQYLRSRKIIAESWMDEYKYYFYSSSLDSDVVVHEQHSLSVGGTTGIVNNNGAPSTIERMKKDLQCRPFAFYLQTVFYELKFPNEDYIAFGKLSSGGKCLKIAEAASGKVVLLVKNCYHRDVTHWFLDAKDGSLRSDTGACLNAEADDVGRPMSAAVVVYSCVVESLKSQSWMRKGGKLIHENTGLCLDNPLSAVVTMSKCRREAPSQLFTFSVELELQQGE